MNGSQISGIFCTQVFLVACVAGFERGRELKEGEPRSLGLFFSLLTSPSPPPFASATQASFLGIRILPTFPQRRRKGGITTPLKK